MENEKRLIDANALMDAFRSYMVERYDKEKCVSEENCKTCENSCLWRRIVGVAPTVDAVVLPCDVGTQVWLIKWWFGSTVNWEKQKEPLPRNVHHFEIAKSGVFAHFSDGCINVKYFGEIVFFTKEEAKAALAKMDGGNEDE